MFLEPSVCVPSILRPVQNPTSDVEKDDLFRAGLGEKEVVFESLDLDTDEFKKVLYEAYPQTSLPANCFY